MTWPSGLGSLVRWSGGRRVEVVEEHADPGPELGNEDTPVLSVDKDWRPKSSEHNEDECCLCIRLQVSKRKRTN